MNQPSQLDEPVLDGLQRISESIVAAWQNQLAQLLQTDVTISLHVVQPCRLGDSMASLSDPACAMEVIETSGNWLVDVGPCLVMPIAHRLLGGGASSQLKPNRPFTKIERQLMRCVTRPLVELLDPCWSTILTGNLQLGQETSAPVWADWEAEVVQLAFLIQLDQHQGYVTLCLPAQTVCQHALQLASWQAASELASEHEDLLPTGDVSLSLNLPLAQISSENLDDLEVGEVVSTGVAVGSPLELHIQGIPMFQAEAGAMEDNLAARLTGPIVERE